MQHMILKKFSTLVRKRPFQGIDIIYGTDRKVNMISIKLFCYLALLDQTL